MSQSTYATDADLLAYFPELSTIDSGRRALALEDAEGFIDIRLFFDLSRRAHALVAAHILTVEDGGESGPVTAMAAGSISASFAVTAYEAGDTASTKYGRLFLELCKRVPYCGVTA